MGGPVFRAIAAASTFGTSELVQKKPFQDVGEDKPVSPTAGGPLRFIPGTGTGAGASALLTLNENQMKPDAAGSPAEATGVSGVLGETEEQKQKRLDDVAAEERRLRSNRGRASTILSAEDPVSPKNTARRYLGGV